MIVILDFDGTVLTHRYPYLGKDIGAVPVLKKLIEAGHKLILSTMRSDIDENSLKSNNFNINNSDFIIGPHLTNAVNWFKENNIPLYGIQKNPTQYEWTSSSKPYGNLIIDDSAAGCPLIEDGFNRPYIDWVKMEKILQEKGYID